ncbi:hypothetical protein [Sapientia aquatica]|uniref:Uncharacterized protein n=1 Tax=Sapientia aquatica TaxID=1549640 RepID=A0A4R5W1W3_9BURK|nr:hypothetical protein [Sapientia aquatica]TDK66396.1 hypothetical protein E2I14_07940 [Sapientia aquatica]
MQLLTKVFIPLVLVCTFTAAHSKIGNCTPLVENGVEYSSHSNYVQATEIQTGKLIWQTELFKEKFIGEYNPKLEEDVQWNIVCVRTIVGDEILVTDGKHREFKVNKKSGVVSTSEIPNNRK